MSPFSPWYVLMNVKRGQLFCVVKHIKHVTINKYIIKNRVGALRSAQICQFLSEFAVRKSGFAGAQCSLCIWIFFSSLSPTSKTPSAPVQGSLFTAHRTIQLFSLRALCVCVLRAAETLHPRPGNKGKRHRKCIFLIKNAHKIDWSMNPTTLDGTTGWNRFRIVWKMLDKKDACGFRVKGSDHSNKEPR